MLGTLYCVNYRVLRTGSANFSRSGETRQDNDLVALRGVSVCAGFEGKFDWAWGKSREGSRFTHSFRYAASASSARRG